jgi:hypothetical protein
MQIPKRFKKLITELAKRTGRTEQECLEHALISFFSDLPCACERKGFDEIILDTLTVSDKNSYNWFFEPDYKKLKEI